MNDIHKETVEYGKSIIANMERNFNQSLVGTGEPYTTMGAQAMKIKEMWFYILETLEHAQKPPEEKVIFAIQKYESQISRMRMRLINMQNSISKTLVDFRQATQDEKDEL